MSKRKGLKLVRDAVSLELASGFTEQLRGATERAFRLVNLLQGRPISGAAQHYVARVTGLYLQGFEVETVLMCRSALEAALKKRLDEFLNPDVDPPGIAQLIRVAGSEGLLAGYEQTPYGDRGKPQSVAWRALRVKRAGNYVAHEFVGYPPEDGAIHTAFDAVRDLSLVVHDLFPLST